MKSRLLPLAALFLGLLLPPQSASANAGDFAGAVAIGTSYANTITAPTNGLAVQGNVAIGTSTANNPVVANGIIQSLSGGVQFPDGTVQTTAAQGNATSYGGMINKFRNGTFDTWQRGTSGLNASTSGAYTSDGWIVKQTGAAFSCSRASGTKGALYALKCTGGTSNTGTQIYQRIESYVAAPLAGNTVTVQWQYQQTSGSSVTPKVSACYASATDNFSTCTSDLASTSLTACASGTWCTESYTFNVSSNATNGYQVMLDCNTALTSTQACQVTAADIRVTPGMTVGVNVSAPPPELRPVGIEMPFNYRYYYGVSGVSWYAFMGNSGDSARHITLPWPVVMRATPTFSATWASGTPVTDNLTAYGVGFYSVLNNTSGWTFCNSITASAEL